MRDISEAYAVAFTPRDSFVLRNQLVSLAVLRAGSLVLSSGYIVACDPLVPGPRLPFVQHVMPGSYMVDLSLIRLTEDVEYVAMARILITRLQPKVWVSAARRGVGKQAAPKGYRSESGTGCYMDADATLLTDLADTDNIDELLVQLTGNYQPHRYWLEMALGRRLNAILFSTGTGAGSYASYFGIDEEGDTCVLATDFGLVT